VSGDAGRVERFVVHLDLDKLGRSAGPLHKLASCSQVPARAPSGGTGWKVPRFRIA